MKPFPGSLEDWKLLIKNYEFTLSGVDPDVIQEFPAQQIVDVTQRLRDRWLKKGGRLYGPNARMCALKADHVWKAISDFKLPYPPFEAGQYSAVSDISRNEADAFGLTKQVDRLVSFRIPAPWELFVPPDPRNLRNQNFHFTGLQSN